MREMATVPEAVPQQPIRRYINAAVAIHWITALLVVTQVIIGFTFDNMERGPGRMQLFTWHKTIGVLILLMAIVRLVVRLKNPPPPFPPELPRWERIAAVWNHRAFYFLLFALPLTGLIAISGGGDQGTTSLVGGIPFPLLPGLSEAAGDASGDIHVILVFTTLFLLLFHIGAALKQQFVDRPGRTSGRMPPFRPRTGEPVVEYRLEGV